MGLTDVDLAYIGVKNAAQRKALKMAAGGFVELMLHVEISGFFNYNSELVRMNQGNGQLVSLRPTRRFSSLMKRLCGSVMWHSPVFSVPFVKHCASKIYMSSTILTGLPGGQQVAIS